MLGVDGMDFRILEAALEKSNRGKDETKKV